MKTTENLLQTHKKQRLRPVILALLASILVIGLGVIYWSARNTTWLPAPLRKAAQAAPIEGSREEKWIADIDYYAAQLPRLHINAFHSLSQDQFNQEITALKSRVTQLSDDQIGLELVRITAAIGDAHTRAVPAQWRQANLLPVRPYWFDDGMFISGVMPHTKDTLGARLVKVGNTPLDQVLETLKPYISDENEMNFRSDAPMLLVTADVLRAIGLVPDAQQVDMTFETADGSQFTRTLSPVGSQEYRQGISNQMTRDEKPMYLRDTGINYWFDYLPETQTLYFQYNTCAQSPDLSMNKFSNSLFAAMDENEVSRLVIDLRFNGGGNSTVLDPFIERLSQHRLSQEGRVYVFISRNTFSSAILNALDLQSKAGAQLVGEPSSQRLDHYGEVKHFTLPNSGLMVTYSTKYFSIASVDEKTRGDDLAGIGIWLKNDPPKDSGIDALRPDMPVSFTSQDFLNKRDPLLEAIQQLP
jgi:hypothetical protein